MQTVDKDYLEFLSKEEITHLLTEFPETQRLLEVKGSTEDYFNQLRPVELSPNDNRRDHFVKSLSDTVRRVHGHNIADSLEAQLPGDFTASTAEHLNSLTEPYTLNTVYNQAIYRKARLSENLLTLACATVRLNNLLEPRSFFLGTQKIHFLSEKKRKEMVLCVPAFDPQPVRQKFEKALPKVVKSKIQQEKIMQWWDDCIGEISSFERFWEQVCAMNRIFWESLVKLNDLPLPSGFIMVPSTVVVRDGLIREIDEGQEDSWLLNALLYPRELERLISCLNGVRSCWSSNDNSGTILFWANVNRKPIPLVYQKGHLISERFNIAIPVEKDALREALITERIVPASSLSMLYLFFYLGLNIFGGLLQIQYLPVMQKRILDENPLGLDPHDYNMIRKLRPDFYLNFEIRTISEGGLLRIVEPIEKGAFDQYKKRSFQGEIQGCLRYLYDLASKD